MKKLLLPCLVIVLWLAGCNLPKPRTPTAVINTPIPTPVSATATPDPTPTRILPSQTPTEPPTPQVGFSVTGVRTYDAAFEVKLVNSSQNSADRLRVVVALISTRLPFQKVVTMNISHPYTLETDEYGNEFAVFELNDFAPGMETTLLFEYRLEVYALQSVLGTCEGEDLLTDLSPELYLESDAPEILNYAQTLAEGKTNPCEIARAYYDFVAENMDYVGYNPGDVGALAALESLEGDCTEFSDLYTALLRAGGIPARPVEGLTCCTTREEYSAGNIKHNWLLAYLPPVGWAPFDPTWGRFENQREAFFAAIDDQHIILTLGRNPAAMSGYHGFTYTWWGSGVQIDHEESWSVLEVVN